jgi:hypothetical protein
MLHFIIETNRVDNDQGLSLKALDSSTNSNVNQNILFSCIFGMR